LVGLHNPSALLLSQTGNPGSAGALAVEVAEEAEGRATDNATPETIKTATVTQEK